MLGVDVELNESFERPGDGAIYPECQHITYLTPPERALAAPLPPPRAPEYTIEWYVTSDAPISTSLSTQGSMTAISTPTTEGSQCYFAGADELAHRQGHAVTTLSLAPECVCAAGRGRERLQGPEGLAELACGICWSLLRDRTTEIRLPSTCTPPCFPSG